ncbi:unnamed protein product [Arabidopsis thaliana]|uniref:F-box domain-containing protein n=1 Tax=Arabidopsis thaliana TaxID=3702 RepID=A0A178VUH3_ARATH|nr:hypothetical protein AXX17_AT2G01340 [Arabidopsis thaliana]CAA0354692.1 unnamed protein product [Arabidopsis thaliana]
MNKTRNVQETRALLAIKGHFHKFVERLKTLKLFLASEKSHGVSELSPFDSLPEVCISLIISFTSPRDACVVALVSKTFESAANSNIAWEKFIPPEYPSMVRGSQYYTSKKELFFDLCHNSLLIDDGEKSFWIERASGKRCIMLSVMSLSILKGVSPRYCEWRPYHESRFENIVELLKVREFGIRGRMNTRDLSPRTRYSVYIVFKITENYFGFGDVAIEAVVGVVGHEPSRRSICFDEFPRKGRGRRRRKDVWMEIELGEFFNEGGLGNSDEIEMSALECPEQPYWKCGLIIQGIEIRPTKLQY